MTSGYWLARLGFPSCRHTAARFPEEGWRRHQQAAPCIGRRTPTITPENPYVTLPIRTASPMPLRYVEDTRARGDTLLKVPN